MVVHAVKHEPPRGIDSVMSHWRSLSQWDRGYAIESMMILAKVLQGVRA